MPDPKDIQNSEKEFEDSLDTLRFDNDEVSRPAMEQKPEADRYDRSSNAEDEEELEPKFTFFKTVGLAKADMTPEESEELMIAELKETMDYALDQDGRKYTDRNEFMQVLKEASDDKTFFIFDGSEMRGVQNMFGIYRMTKDPVTLYDQIPNMFSRDPFVPKPSLKLSDIAAPTDFSYISAKIKDDQKIAAAIKAHPKEYIARVQRDADRFEKTGFEEIRASYCSKKSDRRNARRSLHDSQKVQAGKQGKLHSSDKAQHRCP